MSISVIIPIKNRANLLPYTLNNILSQYLLPKEIIVVDDHSTDHLSAVKEEYKKNVSFIPSEGHGPGAARNTGYKESTGKYIQFFDSDDLMTIDKLKIQFDQLEQSGRGMAYCPHVKAIESIQGDWKQADDILYYKPLSKRLRYDQWVIRGACMITQSCLFRRELIEEAGLWRTDLMPHEDFEFLFRIGVVEPYPVHSAIPAVIYRQHQNQITDQSTSVQLRALDQLNACYLIYQQMKGRRYTFWDHKVMANQMSRSASFVDKELWPTDYNNINHSTINKMALRIETIFHSLQRRMTRSNWRFVHGVSTQPEHFEQIISKLIK
jgi:glycosyltransferase involved in cell wall biosynthesis